MQNREAAELLLIVEELANTIPSHKQSTLKSTLHSFQHEQLEGAEYINVWAIVTTDANILPR